MKGGRLELVGRAHVRHRFARLLLQPEDLRRGLGEFLLGLLLLALELVDVCQLVVSRLTQGRLMRTCLLESNCEGSGLVLDRAPIEECSFQPRFFQPAVWPAARLVPQQSP